MANGKCTKEEPEVSSGHFEKLAESTKTGLPITQGSWPANINSGHYSHHCPLRPTAEIASFGHTIVDKEDPFSLQVERAPIIALRVSGQDTIDPPVTSQRVSVHPDV